MGRVRDALDALTGRSVVRRSHRLGSLSGRNTAAGVTVSPEQALQVTAVYSSVRLVSETIAALPFSVVRRRDGQRLPVTARDAAVVSLLTERANPQLDASEFWRTVVAHMLIRGNSYVYVQRNGAGEPIGLWPIPPAAVEVLRTGFGLLAYRVHHDQKNTWLPDVEPDGVIVQHNMLHYRWFGTGPEGLSPIGVAREQIGTSVAATGYIGGFFARDATPGAVITTSGNLTDKQWNRLVDQFEERHQGFENSHRLAVFEGGAKLEQTTLSPADAQFLAIYKMTRTEVASLYGIPPHKIGDLEHATFSNIEHMSIEFVQDGIVPPVNRLEWVTRQLFTDPELRLKVGVNGLMRGDTAARQSYYASGRQWGYLSANDIRAFEDMDPIEGGDEYLVPINMLPATSTPEQRSERRRATRSERQPASEESPAAVTRMRHLLIDYFEQQREDIVGLARASRQSRGALDVDRDAWDAQLAGLLVDPFTDIVTDFGSREAAALGGTFAASQAANWVAAASARQARNINETTFSALDDALDDLDEDESAEEAAAGVFKDASALRAGLVAAAIVNTIGAFGRHEGATQAGGRSKTWRVNSGNPRPSHAAMDGETVSIDEPFSNGCMWPGDPSGGADEVAGCTCGVEFNL